MDIVTGVGVLDKAVALLRVVADEPRSLAALQEMITGGNLIWLQKPPAE